MTPVTRHDDTVHRRRIVSGAYWLTALTGVAGLIYQITWQRYLGRLLGNDTLATATVLGVFLGGLSLGFLLWGRFTTRSRDPLFVYAGLEGLIGLWGLLFPWLFTIVDRATSSWSFAPGAGLPLQGVLAAGVLIGLPTLCMGATIPMLTRALTTSLDQATSVNARIYAFNTVGAVLGAAATGFVVIRVAGLPGAVRLAGLLNLLAAGYFLLLARRFGPLGDPPARRARTPVVGSNVPRWILHAIGFVGGFAFMTLEPLVIRLTSLSVGSSTYSLSLVIASFLTCIALGALVVARRRQLSPASLFVNQVVACASMMAVFVTLDEWPYAAHRLRILFGHELGDFVGYQASLFVTLTLVLALPVGCMGATLPLAFDALKRGLGGIGRDAGSLFAWNALGNLLGGLIGGYVVYRFLDAGEVFMLAMGLTAVTALLASLRLGTRPRVTAVGLVIVSLAFAWWQPSHEPLRFAVGTFHLHEAIAYSRDGADAFYRGFHEGRTVVAYADEPEATVAVVENRRLAEALRQSFPSLKRSIVSVPSAFGEAGPAPRSILINGKADSSTFYDRETLRLAAHLPALLALRRDRVLVVGLGTGVTAGELSLYPEVRTIDVAEISTAVARMLPQFGEWTHGVHEDPRLHLQIGDALRILRRSDRRWDLVVSQPSNPWMSGSDPLFSRDYYRLVRERLEPDGLFLSWMQRYATNERIAALILNALMAEFPHVRLFRVGSDDLLLASLHPVGPESMARADELLAGNPRVSQSLREIRIDSHLDLLAREHPDAIDRALELEAQGLETLDHPRVHFLAGLAFFRGDDPDVEMLLRGLRR